MTEALSDSHRGVYDSTRAAALAGVPKSTLNYWARTEFVRPSASISSPRLWSWGDLLVLRAVEWIRRGSPDFRRVPLPRIREALAFFENEHLPLHEFPRLALVSSGGRLFVEQEGRTVEAARRQQSGMADVLLLIRPFGKGPDLLSPRPHLRILPGKLSGEPHVVGTRIASQVIYALALAGYSTESIVELYPDLSGARVEEAVELEQSLAA
jgi:uncharacterized protein (DUF433 family)/DNA-binding transcriptional MerR regulator